ncbi:glycosyltransferase family 2 protein [uncultured Desulfosarcina sp.]|uniref:glycosyltransferase family 2 protein n=1 Tax=uncultured Desulfosarcina sp. TaxID=218289 RepID=UPI0029C979C6|nr:glycosyltransferase family 2 protein [uncultured Desulfosarcina sp.]
MADRSNVMCSVCVANYNGKTYLRECIDSIISQNIDKQIEIIVHDDASTDDSVEFLKRCYPDIIVIQSKVNCGFCISNNRMVEVAKGEYILLLNNDAVLRKDAIKTLYNASRKYGTGIFGLPQYNAQTNHLIDMGSLLDPFLNPIPNTTSTVQNVGMIIGACLWLPKSLWKTLGGFPDWFGSMAEDMYLCCLARLRGIQVKAVAYSGFDHWVGRSFGGGKIMSNGKLSTTLKRRVISERNKSFVMILCYPSPLAWILVPFNLLLLCIEGGLLSLIKMDTRLWSKIYWHCLKEIWKDRRMLKEKRRLIQKTRRCSVIGFFNPFQWVPYKLSMLLKYGLPHIDN